MSKARIILVLGTWVAILPYLGFPSSWKNILFTLSGLVLMYFSYIMYKNSKKNDDGKKIFDNFRENNNFSEINEAVSKTVNQEQSENEKTD